MEPNSRDRPPPWRNTSPFLYALAFTAVASIAIARLPDSTIVALRSGGPLTEDAATWAYRLIAVAAVLQALYGGWAILRPERVRRAMESEPVVGAMPRHRIARTVARNAAGMIALTVVYGLAIFLLTGRRGGFWLFVLVATLQCGWYYRQSGAVSSWLAHQEPPPRVPKPDTWRRERDDYCPPLARRLSPGDL